MLKEPLFAGHYTAVAEELQAPKFSLAPSMNLHDLTFSDLSDPDKMRQALDRPRGGDAIIDKKFPQPDLGGEI